MDLPEKKILVMVMAGGKGEGLFPLTEYRTPSAVPFGGMFRLIDFVLSNLVNSRIKNIYILTQYKPGSLEQHLRQVWGVHSLSNGYRIKPVRSEISLGHAHYNGDVHLAYQRLDHIREEKPSLILVFRSDQIFCMDVRQMIKFHLDRGAEVTVSTIPMPVNQCSEYRTVCVDSHRRIKSFEKKNPDHTHVPGRPDLALVSMKNYVFKTEALIEELIKDVGDENSSHDFEKDILPKICKRRKVVAYDFRENRVPGSKRPTDYWRELNTLENYYLTHMDLNNPLSHLTLYNKEWPLRTGSNQDMPPQVIEDLSGRSGFVENSILGNSTIICGANVRNCIIGPHVRIMSKASVRDSVILGDVIVEKGAHIHKAVIDYGNIIRAFEKVENSPDHNGNPYYIHPSGIIVVPMKKKMRYKKREFLLQRNHII